MGGEEKRRGEKWRSIASLSHTLGSFIFFLLLYFLTFCFVFSTDFVSLVCWRGGEVAYWTRFCPLLGSIGPVRVRLLDFVLKSDATLSCHVLTG